MGKRILCVVPPFHGHLNPAIAIAGQLLVGGHEVAWVTSATMSELLPTGAAVYDSSDDSYERAISTARDVAARPRLDQLTAYYEEIVLPLAVATFDDVMQACSDFQPDVLLVDQHAPSGAVAAARLDLPWATSAPSAQLLNPYSQSRQSWIDEQVAQLAASCGAPPVKETSEALILSYISPLLVPPEYPLPAQTKFVGPALDAGQRIGSEVLTELHAGPRVLVSLSSIYGELADDFLLKVAHVLDRAGIQGVFSTTSQALDRMPASAVVKPWLPHPRLFTHFDAVLNHGGSTTLEALYYGRPLIVAPLSYDNFDYTHAVVHAGAGIRVRAKRATMGDIAHAVDEVLHNASYREAANTVGASLRSGGGAAAAAEALLELAT